MRSRVAITITIVSVILAASVAIAFNYYAQNSTSVHYFDEVPGYQIIVGNNSASDGRIKITVNNYHFTSGTHILLEQASGVNGTPYSSTPVYSPGDGETYLLVNVTFDNIGNGSTWIGSSSSFLIVNGNENYSNSEYAANAIFPKEFPNSSIPVSKHSGGINLDAGKSVTYWVIFGIFGSSITNINGFTLKEFAFFENEYGGTYDGSGGYSGGIDPHVEFIILPR